MEKLTFSHFTVLTDKPEELEMAINQLCSLYVKNPGDLFYEFDIEDYDGEE